jgi:hypothetical protein
LWKITGTGTPWHFFSKIKGIHIRQHLRSLKKLHKWWQINCSWISKTRNVEMHSDFIYIMQRIVALPVQCPSVRNKNQICSMGFVIFLWFISTLKHTWYSNSLLASWSGAGTPV